MEGFKISFQVLSVFGVWRPRSFTSTSDKTLYNVYRVFIIPLPYLLEVGLICRLLFDEMTFDEFTETLFMCLTTTCVCCKSINFLMKRKEVINLSNMLMSNYAKSQNNVELTIQNAHNKFIRFYLNLFS